MKTFYVKEAPVVGFVAGGESNFQIQSRYKLHSIELLCLAADGVTALTRAQMISDIDYIQVRRGDGNKDIIFDRRPAQILDLDNDYHFPLHNALAQPGILRIDFDRPHMPTEYDSRLPGLGMANMGYIQVYIKYLNPMATLASIAVATEFEETLQGLGTFLMRRRYTRSFGAAALQVLTDLYNAESGSGILALHFDQAVGTILNASVVKNDKDWTRELLASQIALRSTKADRTPQAGWFHIDFALGNDPLSFMSISDLIKLHLELNWSVLPNAYEICSEEIKGVTAAA